MLFTEMITSFYKNRTENINLVCGVSIEIAKLNREVGNINHCALNWFRFQCNGLDYDVA